MGDKDDNGSHGPERSARRTRRAGGCSCATIRRTTGRRAGCRPRCGRPRTRCTATSAPPTRSSTARAARRRPAARRAALDAWEEELRGGRASRPAGRARADRRRRARTTCRSASSRTYMRSMRDRLRAGADRQLGRARSPTWTARRARSAGSWPRCSACPSASTPTSAGSASAFQLANFIRDVREDWRLDRIYLPRGLRAIRRDRGDLRARRRRELRALLAHEVARARGAVRRRRAGRSPPRRPRCAPASGSRARLYGRMLDRVEAAGCDVLGRRVGVRVWRPARRCAGGAAVSRRRRCAAPSARRSTSARTC